MWYEGCFLVFSEEAAVLLGVEPPLLHGGRTRLVSDGRVSVPVMVRVLLLCRCRWGEGALGLVAVV